MFKACTKPKNLCYIMYVLKITRENPILVTGGAGFVGSHLIERLVTKYPNSRIISVDKYITGSKKNHIKSSCVRYLKGDAANITSIWSENKFKNPSVVFHLGEYPRIEPSWDEPEFCIDNNFNSTFGVINFCLEKKAKLIYAGSSSKFGNNGEDKHLSPYSWVKAINIELINNYSKWFDLDCVVTYFYNVYGGRQIKKGKYATIIGIFEDQYSSGKPLTVVKPGTQTRDFTHVDDIVSGILICAEKGSGDGYHIGTGREWTIIEVAKLFKGAKIKMLPQRKGDRKRGKSPSSSKTRKLGWEPKVKLDEYIKDFLGRS